MANMVLVHLLVAHVGHYCFNKKGRFARVLGGNESKLKKCFKDEKHAIEGFEKELLQNLSELQKHGLLFSFTTDPMLKQFG